MYTSLTQHCRDFHLYIFAFDDLAYKVLTQLTLPNVTVISLREFEDEELLCVKPGRSKGEYCWTCTPSTIKYCIDRFKLDHCTYLDADLFFYGDPTIIFNELLASQKDVLITEHNYAAKYDQSVSSGKYCVQFMVFLNTTKGMEVLNWWRNACIDWCYARHEEGRFGDQKYLDDWTVRYKCVHVCKQPGAGVAPWNACAFKLFKRLNREYFIRSNEINDIEQKLIFYHFHAFRMFKDKVVWGIGYFLPKESIVNIYQPYTNLFLAHFDFIHRINPEIVFPVNNKLKPRTTLELARLFLKDILKFFYYKLKGVQFRLVYHTYYIYRIKNGKLIRP